MSFLQMASKDSERQNLAALKASAFLADMLRRYSIILAYYRDPDPKMDAGPRPLLEDRVVCVFAAILRYSSEVMKTRNAKFRGEFKETVYISTSELY
jgi:hypothetical protein